MMHPLRHLQSVSNNSTATTGATIASLKVNGWTVRRDNYLYKQKTCPFEQTSHFVGNYKIKVIPQFQVQPKNPLWLPDYSRQRRIRARRRIRPRFDRRGSWIDVSQTRSLHQSYRLSTHDKFRLPCQKDYSSPSSPQRE